MRIGDQVTAAVQVSEENFAGSALHVHAEPGDAGVVVYVDPTPDALPFTVQWNRTGTISGCVESELEIALLAALG